MADGFDRERYDERLADFGQALMRLEEAMQMPETDIVRDSIVHRFEFTYELAWKTMKRWLEAKGIVVRNPKDTLTAALEQEVIEDGNAWSELQKCRNITSHTYNEEYAKKVVAFLRKEGLSLMKTAHRRLGQWHPGK